MPRIRLVKPRGFLCFRSTIEKVEPAVPVVVRYRQKLRWQCAGREIEGEGTMSVLFPTYARSDLSFDHGQGAWLVSKDGRRYLDFAAGIAVNALGHAHPHLVEALKNQAEKLWHVSNLYQMEGQESLGQRLCDATFAERVFFTNSGAEALECAIKTARRYFFAKGEEQRYRIITMEGAFHGRTMATIAAGGQEQYIQGFGPRVAGFDQVPFGDLDAVKAAITDETAAILVEPIQGEGGIRPMDGAVLKGLRALADEAGLLLLLDEVQTGIGRTGKLFAHEWSGITPDIMAVAKGIGGGFPLGACLATEEVASSMVPGTHGSTYGGNPLATAVGNAVLDIVLEPDFLPGIERKGLLLKQKTAAIIDEYPELIENVRGAGLMMGLKARVPNADIVGAFRQAGLLSVGAGDNVVRFLPPLTITEDDIDAAMDMMAAGLQALQDARSGE